MPSSNSGFPVIFSDVTWCLMLWIGTLLAEFGSQACFVLLIRHLRTRWYHPEIQIPCCSWWVKSSDKLALETSVYHSVSTKWPRHLPVGGCCPPLQSPCPAGHMHIHSNPVPFNRSCYQLWQLESFEFATNPGPRYSELPPGHLNLLFL